MVSGGSNVVWTLMFYKTSFVFCKDSHTGQEWHELVNDDRIKFLGELAH